MLFFPFSAGEAGIWQYGSVHRLQLLPAAFLVKEKASMAQLHY